MNRPRLVVAVVALAATSAGCRAGGDRAAARPDATLVASGRTAARRGPVMAPMRPTLTCDSRPVASVAFDKPRTSGIDALGVGRRLAGARAGFRACYRRGLKTHVYQQGEIHLAWTLSGDGTGEPSVRASGDLDDAIVKCVKGRASAVHFPDPDGGTATITVTARFVTQ